MIDKLQKAMTADEQNIPQLIKAIEKHGTVNHYHFRPVRDCFAAGFCYALGGAAAADLAITFGKAITWAVGFIAGLMT